VFGPISVDTTEIAPIRVNSGLVFTEKERAFIHSWKMGGNDSIGKGISLAFLMLRTRWASETRAELYIDFFEDMMNNSVQLKENRQNS
jgi:hypothetical protein